MKEMILLGAGASIDAGIPGSYEMTKKMLDIIESNPRNREYVKVLYFVSSGLLHNYGAHGKNPFNGVNVEELFNAIQFLSDRDNLEISPFIYSWSPYITDLESRNSKPTLLQVDHFIQAIYKPLKDELNHNRRSTPEEILDNLRKTKFRSNPSIRRELVELIQDMATVHRSAIFKETLKTMVSVLIDLVWIKDKSKLDYLIPLVQYAANNQSFISTLNYDNSIELIGEQSRDLIDVDTGIDEYSSRHEFVFRENAIPLLKLHGSINWRLEDQTRDQNQPMPKQIIDKVQINPSSAEKGEYQPAIIFGGTNKLTAKGPFLDLLRAFREKLFLSSKLIVIGYSFRDEHINEYISQWINIDPKHKLLIVDPIFNQYQDQYHRTLQFLERNGKIELYQNKAKEIIPNLFKI